MKTPHPIHEIINILLEMELLPLAKRDKGRAQKGKPNADTSNNTMAAEEMEKAIHPTNRQNSEQ
ncbi:hypothetical protein DZB84_11800 [Bacillus sp. HNG]|nr:hypothetical protein DZB84_11800 [Bacillus sp. HNG]